MSDFLRRPLAELARGLRAKEWSARDLVGQTMDLHDTHSSSLNAYITWDPKMASLQARAVDAAVAAGIDCGPLQGLPVSVKDLFGVAGFPTFAGTPRELPAEWAREGPVVRQLRKQQSVITGKTHTVEFAFGGLGFNPHWKTPRNPWDAAGFRVPGGSSSGAGVSLCVGSSVLALGTDTAGSVRIPASMTGNVGLKTSSGRWDMAGIVPLSPSLDSVGILTRTVEDAVFAFDALDSQLCTLPGSADWKNYDVAGLRAGISDGLLWSNCSAGVAESVDSAIDELTSQGVRPVSLALPQVEQVLPLFQKGGLAAPELHMFLKNSLPDWVALLDPKIAQRMENAATMTACEYLERVALLRKLSAQMEESMQSVDILICPTVPITAPTIDEIGELGRYREANLLSLRNTCFVNFLGLCALTMPVGLDDQGIPVGMQLIAPGGYDRKLLAIARGIERCLGSARARLGEPPLLAQSVV